MESKSVTHASTTTEGALERPRCGFATAFLAWELHNERTRVGTPAPLTFALDDVEMQGWDDIEAVGAWVLIHKDARSGAWHIRLAVSKDTAFPDTSVRPKSEHPPAVVASVSGGLPVGPTVLDRLESMRLEDQETTSQTPPEQL